MEVKIKNLNTCKEYIPVVVNWLYSEWGDNNFEYWKSWINSSLNSDVPMTFVALVDNEIAGTYSLWRCDLQSRQDLFPWFGGLFIDEKYRGKTYNNKKLGSLLQEHSINILKSLGYSKVYLFTEKAPKYYIENGWKFLETAVDENDNLVSLCYFDIL